MLKTTYILFIYFLSAWLFMCNSTSEKKDQDDFRDTGDKATDSAPSHSTDKQQETDSEEQLTVWGKQVGTPDDDWFISVAVDHDDTVWVVGSTAGKLGTEQVGKEDALMVQFKTNGDEKGRTQFGSDENDAAQRVSVDSDNNIIVVGYTEGTLGDVHLGSKDVFVSKFDTHRKAVWTTQFGTDAEDTGECLFIDDENNILVGGGTYGTLGETSNGSQDGFLTKLTKDGEVQWHTQFGTKNKEFVQGIAVDGDKNIYAVISHFETATSYIAKYKPTGDLIEEKLLSGIKALDVHITETGQIFVSGFSGNQSIIQLLDEKLTIVWSKSFSSGNWSGEKEIVPVGDDRIATSGCMNWPDCYGFVRLYDLEGTLLASETIRKSYEPSETKTTCGAVLAADSDGAVYHVGGTQEDLFDDNQGKTDGFLVKIKF